MKVGIGSATVRVLRRVLMVGVVATALGTAVDGLAQTDTSRAARLDREAREAFARGDFTGAAEKFGEAYEAAPHPATKYNQAMALDQAGAVERAADAYEQVISLEGLDDDRLAAARERLAELERVLGVLNVPGPAIASVSVGHVRDGKAPARIHLAPGLYQIRLVRSDGREVQRSVQIAAGKVVELVLEVTKERVVEAPQPSGTTTSTTTFPPPAATETTSSQRTWGWVAVGGAGVFAIGAGYLGTKTLRTLDDYEASGYRDAELRDRSVRYKTWTNVAWTAAALSGAAGLVLLLSARDGPDGKGEADQRGAHVHVSAGGVSIGATF